MKIQELKIMLEKEMICKNLYSFFGDDLGDRLVLSKDIQNWIVYYTEKGERYDAKLFNTEEQACDYFFNEILKTPAARYRVFTNSDFHLSPIWVGNDNIGYKPVHEKNVLLQKYLNVGDVLIKAVIFTPLKKFEGYVRLSKTGSEIGIFVGNNLTRFSTNPIHNYFNEDNLAKILQLLECSTSDLFPIQYESTVFIDDTKITGIFNKIS